MIIYKFKNYTSEVEKELQDILLNIYKLLVYPKYMLTSDDKNYTINSAEEMLKFISNYFPMKFKNNIIIEHSEEGAIQFYSTTNERFKEIKNTMSRLEKVKEFQKTFGHPVANKGSKINYNRAKIRLALILEELYELSEAFGIEATFQKMMIDRLSIDDYNKEKLRITLLKSDNLFVDNSKVLDALCDLEVVLLGTVCETGYHEEFDNGFDEVHTSNMSKTCNSLQKALDTIAKYQKAGRAAAYKTVDDKYVIYDINTNKILKSMDYTPADLSKFI